MGWFFFWLMGWVGVEDNGCIIWISNNNNW